MRGQVNPADGYNRGGGRAIRTLLVALLVAGLLLLLLGALRVPFAVRFWRRMQLLMWVYFAVVVFAAVRLWFFT